MVDISSQNNKINITVSSSGNTANTKVTPDYAQYYSEKSKEWATSNKIVDNIDYSSKYYANESKKQADISTAKATEVVESGNTAVSNIESARDNAITDITNQESLSVDNVNTAGATQIALATEQATIATEQATIATNKTSEVVASGNEVLSNIDTAKTGAITDITNLKNTSISDINTTKDNAITTITTQETTSKTSLIDEGATQIGLIQNEGATQVANVQSTGQTEYNKIIATGIDYKANTDLSNLSEAGEKHFLNKSNKSEISGWGMPSNKYIDLTLGASGSRYTAPANGYFQLAVLSGKSIQFYNTTKASFWKASVSGGIAFAETMECTAGDEIDCYYEYTTFRWFRFYYAEGSKGE